MLTTVKIQSAYGVQGMGSACRNESGFCWPCLVQSASWEPRHLSTDGDGLAIGISAATPRQSGGEQMQPWPALRR